jgi:hypothetical protein
MDFQYSIKYLNISSLYLFGYKEGWYILELLLALLGGKKLQLLTPVPL